MEGARSPAGIERPFSWGRAARRAFLLLAASVLAFAVIPDRLLTWLSGVVSPVLRDLIVLLWFILAFLLISWLFVRLQRGRRA